MAAFKKFVWLHFMLTRVLDLFVVLFTVKLSCEISEKRIYDERTLEGLGHQFNCNSMKLFNDMSTIVKCYFASGHKLSFTMTVFLALMVSPSYQLTYRFV